jgi:hypothetical protein
VQAAAIEFDSVFMTSELLAMVENNLNKRLRDKEKGSGAPAIIVRKDALPTANERKKALGF